jgi:putative ABC transport system permease protein
MTSKALQLMARSVRRNPGILGLVVLTLGLGIGGTTAVFGVVDALLIRPLPYSNSDRLLEVWTEQTPAGRRTPGLGGQAFRALRSERGAFAAVEAYQFGAATLTGDGEPAIVSAPLVSPGLLHVLSVVPRLGRLFSEDETGLGERVVLISGRLWTARFGRAPDVIGRRLSIDDEPHTIVGVLPARFAFPEQRAEVWRPLFPSSAQGISGRAQTIVMLRPEATRPSANDQLRAVSTHLQNDAVLGMDRRLVFEDLLQRRYGRQYGTALYVMLGAVGLVLLVACVNVTNLLLARATARQSEFALMGALGASRTQLVTQVMVESLVLALLACASGLLIAKVLLATILDFLPPQLSMLSAVATLDWRALVFATCVSTLTCVAVGLLPALRVGRIGLIESLKGRAPGVVDHGGEKWQSGLVIAQLALVLVLLTGAGLLLRSFVRLVNVDPGFEPANMLVFEIQLPDGRYQTPGSSLVLFETLDKLVESAPGVTRATFSEGAPPSGGSISVDIRPEAEGRASVDASGLRLPHSRVAPDYFTTMGIPLLEGRTFARDDTDDVVIVNDVLGRRFWGSESPVGRRFRLDSKQPWQTVVGVARDVKQMGLNDPMGDGMEVYYPYERGTTARFFTLIVRAGGNEADVVRQVKERLWTLDARLPVIEAMTMEQRLVESVARPRFFLRLGSAFAGMAILLAGVGVYGTAAYWVARRRRELGIRMALGATQTAVLALVVGRSIRLAAWGCAIGLGASLSVTRVLNSLLFETGAREPTILIGVTMVLAGLVVTACYFPALRASRIDPATVLRAE